MFTQLRYVSYILLVLVFAACGGGGGGGGGGSTTVTGLTLSGNSMQFDAAQNGALPATQSLTASWSSPDVAAIVAGYPTNITPPSWLDLSIQGAASPMSIDVAVNTTALSPGSYSTTVRVVSVDINANPIDVIDVNVTLNIQAKLGISGSNALTFNMVDGGQAPADQSVSLVGDGINWTATTSAAWVQLGSTSGTAPGNVSIGVNPVSLNVGTHTATVTFTDSTSSDTVLMNVTLNIQSGGGSNTGLTLSDNTIQFDAIQNGALPATQTIIASWGGPDVAAVLVGYPPNVSQPPWLDIATQGSASPVSINMSANTTALLPGTYATTVRVVSVDNNTNPIDTIDVNVTLTVEAQLGIAGSTTFTFNMVDGGSAPQNQSVSLVGDGISWTAVASEAWVQLGSASGTAPSMVSIGVNQASLNAGTHTATVTFTDSASSDTVVVDVTLNLQAQLDINGGTALTFDMVDGGLVPVDQVVNLGGDGVVWNAVASEAWVQLGSSSGTAPSTVSIGVNPASLNVGTHTATVTFTDSLNIQSVVLDVTLNIQPVLSVSGSKTLTFNMVDSGLTPLDQSVDLVGSGISWNAVASEPWVVLGTTTGTAPGAVSIGVDPAALNAGIHTATVTFADSLSLQSVTVDVELRIEPHRLVVEDNGIALASMPALSNLSATVAVSENAGVTTPWMATSNAGWLSVTASGDTGNNLSLTADPAGLAADTIYYTTVTLTSSDATISNSETINVGLWVGSADPIASDSLALTYVEITADPIRPYVYMHNQGTDIDVYNVHTATLVTTISNVAAQLGDMEVSADGSTLYVADLTNYDIVPVDLNTMTAGTAWDLSGTGSLWLGYGRVDNKALVFASNGGVYDAGTGAALPATLTISGGSVLNISQNGETLCGVSTGVSPYTISCFTLAYSELASGALTMTSTGSVRGPGGNAKDVALVRDGSRAYVASGAPYNFIGFDTTTMLQDQTLPADAYPNSVEISSDNLLYGGISGLYGPLDTWIYDTAGVEQNSYYVSGYAKTIRDRQLCVSGDGLRVIISVTDPAIKMLTVK